MRLSLCRHAQAIAAPRALRDEDRWLTAFGRARAFAIGEVLRAAGDVPELIFTSPLVRAVQTSEGLARGAAYAGEIVTDPGLAPDGTFGDWLEGIRERTEAHVLVVSHEPMMSGWGSTLLGRRLPHAFGTGCVLTLDFDDAPEPGAARSARFLIGDTGERVSI